MNKYDIIFNEKLAQLIKDVPFTHELLSKFNFAELVNIGLKHHTEDTLEVTLDAFEAVYKAANADNPRWYMPEMFTALNAVKAISPNHCDYSIPNWLGFKRNFAILSAHWQELAAPFIKEAQAFAQDAAKRDQREAESKSKIIQLNGKRGK